MYRTCAFCDADLGRNERVEHFAVGRRVAFDSAKGRLWAVCRACGQWNLAPIEERWEAVEECERIFRSVRTRASTDEIGLARIEDVAGPLDLVRIGAPLRPEFAAWRFGTQLMQRRRRALVQLAGGSAVGLGAGLVFTGMTVGLPLAAGGAMLGALSLALGRSPFARSRPVELIAADGQVLRIGASRQDILRVGMRGGEQPGTFRLAIETVNWISAPTRFYPNNVEPAFRHLSFEGDAAVRGARLLLPRVNAGGATGALVSDAVREIERAGSATAYVDEALRSLRRRGMAYNPMGQYPREMRLALEISLHEDVERRALEGELSLLAEAWQRAEEIAGIADSLLPPPAA
jgi:hypothetical protein